MKNLIFVLIVFLIACPYEQVPTPVDSEKDSGISDGGDSGLDTMSGYARPPYDCYPLRHDRQDPETKLCYCGPSSACGENSICLHSKCVPSDPEGAICEFNANCSAGEICVSGRCSEIGCISQELCDGIDNDCDGQVDITNGEPLAELCTTKGFNVENISPPCRPGARLCVNGQWTECMGGVSPVAEVGDLVCDGIDNNCDGCVDGKLVDGKCRLTTNSLYDVVFVVDDSGSMNNDLEKVYSAVENVSQYRNTSFRFALLSFPGLEERNTVTDPYAIVSDFLPYSNFSSIFEQYIEDDHTGSLEPSYDVLFDVFSNRVLLSWREDAARIIVLFGDENAQSYGLSSFSASVDEQIMCDAIQRGETLIVVTLLSYFSDYDSCGAMVNLEDPQNVLEQEFIHLLDDPCK